MIAFNIGFDGNSNYKTSSTCNKLYYLLNQQNNYELEGGKKQQIPIQIFIY